MKRIIVTMIAIAMLMIASFNMGKSAGVKHVLNRGIITNETRDQGNFIMELDGVVYTYWYE